jgi:hypothetical protein
VGSESLSNLVSACRVDANGWEGRECGSQCNCGERRYVVEILTGVIVRHRR